MNFNTILNRKQPLSVELNLREVLYNHTSLYPYFVLKATKNICNSDESEY